MSYKDDMITFLKARVSALEDEVETLNIEIINRDLKIQQLEDAINK